MADAKRPSAEEIVLYEKDTATKIATITLDRADELNAMTVDAQHRYADLVRNASYDDDVPYTPGWQERINAALRKAAGK